MLSDAKVRVRTLIDDRNSVLVTDAQIVTALTVAQYEAMLWAVSSGYNGMLQEATVVTNSSGLADLSTIKPLKIYHVALSPSAGVRTPVVPVDVKDIYLPYSYAGTLIVSYVPRPVFPANDAASFVWSTAAVSLPPLDHYMCLAAASELKIIDAEVLAGLETRKAELLKQLLSLQNIPNWSSMSMRPRRQNYLKLTYASTAPDSIQLCYG